MNAFCLNIKIFSFLLLTLLAHGESIAQETNNRLSSIINDDLLTIKEKEKKLDSLLENDLRNKKTDSLFINTYDVIKWYYKNRNLDTAIALNKRNILLMDSLEYSKNSFYRKNLYSLGYYLMKNGSNNQTLEYFNSVIELNNTDKLAMFSSKFIAEIHYERHDFYLASEYYENTIRIAKELKNIDYVTENSLHASVCYKTIKTSQSLERAIELLNEAILYEKSNYTEDTYYQGYIGVLNSLHKHLANLYLDRIDHDLYEAKKNYDLSLKYALILNDSLRLSDIYHDLGSYHLIKDHNPKALEYFNKALKYKPDNNTKTFIHKSKSHYYLEKKEFKKSKIEIQKAISTQISSIDNEYSIITPRHHLFDAQNKFKLLDLLINKAVVFTEEAQTGVNKKQNLNKALQIIENADALLDYVRLNTNDFKTKLFWKTIFSELYINATNICYQLNNKEKAFYFIEKNKAILLKEDLEQKRRRDITTIPNHIINIHDSLKFNIEKYKSTNDSFTSLRLVAKQHYNHFIDTLNNKYKSLFKPVKATNVISLSEFKNSIKSSDKAYIQYLLENEFLGFSNRNLGFGMLITKTHVAFFKIKNIEALKGKLQTFTSLLKKPIENKASKEEYNQVSYAIYNTLFPISIKSKLKGKVLTIIPDNFLINISFEALQISTNVNDYLIFKNEINYAYSISFLVENNKLNRDNPKNVIAFAPINFKGSLPSLLDSEKEIKALNHSITSDIFTHQNATKINFKNNITQYKIVHLSSHASANEYQVPNIVFSDSIMDLNEIYRLKNNAELVVLSACETSLGELKKGEGVMSLARGFFNTGANSVASTLWTVNDKSTTSIIDDFYRNLKNGQTKSSALHNAKLNYLKTHSLSEASPYYWASFILIGNTDTIKFSNNNSILYWIIAVAFIFLLLIVIKKKQIVF